MPRLPPGTFDDMMQIGMDALTALKIPDNIIAFFVLAVAYLILIPIVMVFYKKPRVVTFAAICSAILSTYWLSFSA